MADDNNQNNNNQQKNKGGGGGAKGISLGAQFDASAAGSFDNMKAQAVGHAANSVGFIGAIFVAGIAYKMLSSAFGVKPQAAQQQGGGGGQMNPGQLTGAMFQLKKSDPDKFNELMGKLNPPS